LTGAVAIQAGLLNDSLDPFYADPRVTTALAAYLRGRAHLWRTRRVDQFTPVDIHLARHTTTIQGQIGAALVTDFLTRESLEVPRSTLLADGLEMTLCVPAVSQPKHLLLEFTARDDSGRILPVLTRLAAAQFSATYLLSILDEACGTLLGAPFESDLLLLLTTLAYQNPNSLSERVDRWLDTSGLHSRGERDHRSPAFRASRHRKASLNGRHLRDWVRREGDLFGEGTGDALVTCLDDVLAKEEDASGQIQLPDSADVGALSRFGTVSSLLLYAIRDVLKVVVETTPVWVPGDAAYRATFLQDPRTLAKRAGKIVEAISSLNEVLNATPDASPVREEFFRHLDRWTTYAVATIRLGVPFTMEFAETLELEGRPSVIGRFVAATCFSRHDYPIAWKDAETLYLEVSLDDPELRFKGPPELLRFKRSDKTMRREEIRDYFGAMSVGTIGEVSDRVVQVHTARRREESGELFERGEGVLRLRVRIAFAKTVWGIALTAMLGFIVATAYIVSVWWRAIEMRQLPTPLEPVMVVEGFAITLLLWLLTMQQRRPIVHKKLGAASIVFGLSLVGLIGMPVAFAIRAAV